MTIPATSRVSPIYQGNASATNFAFSYKTYAKQELQVIVSDGLTPTTLTLDSDYSVTLNADQVTTPGGVITYPISGSPLPLGKTLVVVSAVPNSQDASLPTGGAFNAAVVELGLDRQEVQLQQLNDTLNRTLRVPVGETVSTPLPAALVRAGYLLGFDANGAIALVAAAAQSASALALNLLSNLGTTFVGGLMAGTGAVFRTIADWLTDTVSSKNFGAKGDYNVTTKTGTNDTLAIQAFWNYCAASGRRGRQIGVSLVDPNTLQVPAAGQLHIIAAGAKLTFDSGYALKTGTAGQRFLTGAGTDLSLAFVNFENCLFEGPGIGSNVDCFYGDFYQGGAQGCLFRNWRTAGTHFGSLNTFRHNRFLTCVNGLLVTNWPAGTSQAGASTTTFVSERNNYNGCTGRGLAFDTTTTGGGNIVSSASILDTFEGGCGTSLYVNKSFDLLILRPHCENSVTNSFVFINSSPNLIPGYFGGGDAAKVSYTWPGAAANGAGYNQLDLSGLLTRGLYLQTKNGVAQMTANDAGGIDLAGTGLVTPWTPALGASSGTTSGNTYSLQEGYALKFGKIVIATWRIVLTAKDAGMGGVLRIINLPFAADGAYSNAYGNQIRYSGVTFGGGTFTELVADITGTFATLTKQGSGLAPTNLAPAEISGTTTLSGTFIYLAP